MLQSRCDFRLLILLVPFIFTEVNGRAPQKIKGGTDAVIADHPYMVAVLFNENLCGGVLISRKHVLTAMRGLMLNVFAESWLPLSSLRVFLAHSRIPNYDRSKVYSVVHLSVLDEQIRQRNQGPFAGDIAVLTLDRYVFSIESNEIPSLPDVAARGGTEGIMLGWGSDRPGGPRNRKLQKATTTIISYDECKEDYIDDLPPKTFCTLGKNRNVSIGDSDSGGPLISNGTIVGIISNTFDSTGQGPNVFTDVFSYKEWILQILGNISA